MSKERKDIYENMDEEELIKDAIANIPTHEEDQEKKHLTPITNKYKRNRKTNNPKYRRNS